MEYVGYEKGPLLLHDSYDSIENKKELFFDILDQYKKIYNKAKLIHGDFSEYNIIIFNNVPYIIDVSQSIPIDSPYSEEFLNRDLNNILNISKKLDLNYDMKYIREYIGI